MKITVDFSEIEPLVKSKAGREIVLATIDERALKVETKMPLKVPFIGEKDISIGLNVAVERIDGQDIHLKYDGRMGVDLIVSGLLTFLSSISAINIVNKMPDNRMVLHLSEIEEARKVLEKVELIGISFEHDAVVVEGRLK